jgi:hypothetical protein
VRPKSRYIDINRVWAQAYSIIQSGETGELKTYEVQHLELMNKRFMRISTEMDVLSRFLVPSKPNEPNAQFMQASEIADYLKDENKAKNVRQPNRSCIKSIGF